MNGGKHWDRHTLDRVTNGTDQVAVWKMKLHRKNIQTSGDRTREFLSSTDMVTKNLLGLSRVRFNANVTHFVRT